MTAVNISVTQKRPPGRPPGRVHADGLNLRLPAEQMRAIDAWRDAQPDKPSRSEAARRLIAAALQAFSALGGRDAAG